MKLPGKKSWALAAVLIASPALGDHGPWTDWYQHTLLVGGLKLVAMRDWLEHHALHDTTPRLPTEITCDDHALRARTADGTCNDLSMPAMGAAGIRFGRNVPLEEAFPATGDDLLSPNPRDVSRALLTRDTFKPVPFLNLMAAGWIQFMVHDWVSHGDNEPRDPFLLPLAADDPLGQREMMVLRSRVDPTRSASDQGLPPTYQNENTHWWDGSQLYGSDLATQLRLRARTGGLLRLDDDGRLPIAADGTEDTGFKRNWWLGLDLFHELFAREHNAIARRLRAAHPDWDDDRIFDTARLVNVAVMAKIHTVEWTPAILQNPILKRGMETNWFGFQNKSKKSVKSPFKFFKDPVVDGIVGGKRETYGVPYALTEEFVSVYRLHSLLPEALSVALADAPRAPVSVPLPELRERGARAALSRFGETSLIYSMGIQHPGALTLNNYPKFLQELDVPIAGKIDLGAVDILRDRERGVPRYNRFRRLLNLEPISSFEELTDDAAQVEKLKRVYGGDVEKIDLLVGTLAESHRPTGFGFGETQFQIFLLNASRRLQADRFFTTDYTEAVYSQEGLDWVDQATFKKVLLRHFPGLSRALEGVENAFNPWNAVGAR